MEKRLLEIQARKLEIRGLLSGTDTTIKLDEIQVELTALETEERSLKKKAELLAGLNAGEGEARTLEKPLDTPPAVNESEKRGKALKENRSVTIASAGVLLTKHQATDIRPTFQEVSSLIDRVSTKMLMGGESYDQPYLAGYGTGDYTAEGEDYTDAEPTFAKATILKTKITTYAEDSEELVKLPAANYDDEVIKGITIASRKKVTREILVGTGAANHMAGIFSVAATAIDIATDLEITVIDEDTLSEIVYSFGGDEEVEDAGVLILNKVDLKAFAQLRNLQGVKIHTITGNGNVGTIDGIPFLINSACKAVTKVATVGGDYCMAYGPLSNYLVTIFSDMDVQRSTDYKFKQGMIAHKGVIFAGGNVVSKNGFLRVKKGAAV
ncbi:MAG TPA: phage major capsid protein [Desulfosporosinus sp.]|nr:phage major capsid protein [Desulfosporosinus sp.]